MGHKREGKNEIKADMEMRKIYVQAYLGGLILIIIAMYSRLDEPILWKSKSLIGLQILGLVTLLGIRAHRTKYLEEGKLLDELEEKEKSKAE